MKNTHIVLSSLLFYIVLSSLRAYATDGTSTWTEFEKEFSRKEISIAGINPVEQKVIESIEVLDMRSDPARLGVNSISVSKPREIVLSGNASISDLLRRKLTSSTGGYSLIFVLQNFWLSDVISQPGSNSHPQLNTTTTGSKLTIKIDVFVGDSLNCYPLVRIDTSIGSRKMVNSSATDLLDKGLQAIYYKIQEGIVSNNYKKKHEINAASLSDMYKNRFSYGVFTDTTRKRGIFRSYEDFKSNKPINTDFEIHTNVNEPSWLFMKDKDGNEYRSRDVWGVCDGKDTYIMQSGFLFRLYKNGNAFYWMGMKGLNRITYGAPIGFFGVYGLLPVKSDVKIRLVPYLMNPDTGKAY